MKKINKKPFSQGELEAISKVIADTNNGITGSEIELFLTMLGYKDIDPYNTKWKRLYNALFFRQNQTQSGNCVYPFISKVLAPSRYIG